MLRFTWNTIWLYLDVNCLQDNAYMLYYTNNIMQWFITIVFIYLSIASLVNTVNSAKKLMYKYYDKQKQKSIETLINKIDFTIYGRIKNVSIFY